MRRSIMIPLSKVHAFKASAHADESACSGFESAARSGISKFVIELKCCPCRSDVLCKARFKVVTIECGNDETVGQYVSFSPSILSSKSHVRSPLSLFFQCRTITSSMCLQNIHLAVRRALPATTSQKRLVSTRLSVPTAYVKPPRKQSVVD